jgi:pullulanase/glycogen debranching enzyme
MNKIFSISTDPNIYKGLVDNFVHSGLDVYPISVDEPNFEKLTTEADKSIVSVVIDKDLETVIDIIKKLRAISDWVHIIVVESRKQHNHLLYDAGADTVLNDEHYWEPLLAQIKAILRRISYNRILQLKETPIAKFDILDLNPFSFPYGAHIFKDYTVFKLFHPDAESVTVELFEDYNKDHSLSFNLMPNGFGDWGCIVQMHLTDWNYGYKAVKNGIEDTHVFADPYAKYLTTTNNHLQFPKAKLVNTQFDWQDSPKHVYPSDIRDLVIYEVHVKDLVGGNKNHKSIYEAFINEALPYIKKLGVNAVEFLPLQKFAYYEPKFDGKLNNWNPYETNYWGYMTTGFFAPETVFSSDGSTTFGEVCGTNGAAISEFKKMVKACHDEGLTVIMDVVYNHISNYDLNPLRLISEDYYLRKNPDGSLRSDSGCGNDFNSENPKARQLIIDSIIYWMQEYRIDGFRFDLANLIDKETFNQLQKEVKLINPQIILIAEPWGGGYDPAGFSNMGLLAWNDKLRNGIKGSSPDHNRGYIFGEWHHGNGRFAIENYLKGTLQGQSNGLFRKSSHAVNYIESHDGYTFGDFIRYATDAVPMGKALEKGSFEKLDEDQLKLAKLGAIFLLCAQGIPMIHAGQEFARAKWNPIGLHEKDHQEGWLSHDSYNKDDATNYIDWQQLEDNKELYTFYKGLIELRKTHSALRLSPTSAFQFLPCGNDFILNCMIDGFVAGDSHDLLLLFNASSEATTIELPDFDWEEILNMQRINLDGHGFIRGSLHIEAKSGYIFRKIRE